MKFNVQFLSSKQFFCALINTMLSTAACVLITWTSPTIPLLTSPNSPIGVKLTNEEVSWVVSALALGMMPGCIVVTLLIDRVGRKKTLLLCGFLMFLPWILIIFANSFAMLLIARFIGGIGGGIGMGVAPLYIGEISQKKHRGALCSMLSIGFVLGTVLMYSIGPFVSYTTLAIFCASIPVIYILAFSFMPDSPYYLIKSNQRQAALDALTYLVLTGNVEEWLNEIECAIQNEEVPKLKLLWREKNYRKSFMIILGCASTLVGKGAFYLKKTEDVDLSNICFIPTLCLTLYYAYNIVWNFYHAAFYSGLLAFVSNTLFNPIVQTWGTHVAFWIFAGVCGFGVCFGLFVLSETKDKTFEEIQDLLRRKTKKANVTTLTVK